MIQQLNKKADTINNTLNIIENIGLPPLYVFPSRPEIGITDGLLSDPILLCKAGECERLSPRDIVGTNIFHSLSGQGRSPILSALGLPSLTCHVIAVLLYRTPLKITSLVVGWVVVNVVDVCSIKLASHK